MSAEATREAGRAARAPENPVRDAQPALAVEPHARLEAGTLLRLQRSAGNRAVVQLLQPPTPTLARKTLTKAEAAKAAFQTAVSASDWANAVKALTRMDQGAAVVLMRACPAADVTSIAGAAKPLGDRKSQLVYRLARFVLNDPGVAAPHPATVSISTRGRLRASARVRGGRIRVRTGGKTKNLGSGLESTERFWLSYEGTDAPRTRWLQFIWREIIATDPVKGRYRVAGTMNTTGGSYALTTDPRLPSYNTDVVPGSANPFYEVSGINNRTADSTTIFDLPYNASDKVDGAFDAGATKVVSRAHFITYLVRDWSVLHKANIDIEWRFAAKGDTPARRQSARVSAANKLEPRQRARLIAQFSNFDYLP